MENEKRYLIVGLGNAEQQYAGTRHNYGFEVANAVAKAFKAEFKSDRLAYVARATFKGRELVILMPTTYMNLSGKAVKHWLAAENVSVDHCLVIYDQNNEKDFLYGRCGHCRCNDDVVWQQPQTQFEERC
ncbi:MAG: aminoacyl-tRNA hydrolase [Bacteroidales bacterium]|nr:aminoacyl-tRNA hydrolase [Bacteroidales bacterium]